MTTPEIDDARLREILAQHKPSCAGFIKAGTVNFFEWNIHDILAAMRQAVATALQSQAAEIERLREADWQPIETAPKDGDCILLLWQAPDCTPEVDKCYWDTLPTADGRELEPSWVIAAEGGCRYARWPGGYTHWMPLPSPPRAALHTPQKEG